MAGLKFRVLLDSSEDEVFRDLLISDEADFETFYHAILDAYGFGDDQMASFYISNNNWDRGHEISLFDMGLGDDDSNEIMPGVMNASIIREFIQYPDQKMILVHDFIRMWIFLIELVEVVKETPKEPKVVLSVGNAPEENSRSGNEDIRFDTEFDEDEEDEFGFGDFDEGFEGFEDFDDYEY